MNNATRVLAAAGALLLSARALPAADDDSVIGTHWVNFQPTSTGDKLTGCSLTFLALHPDARKILAATGSAGDKGQGAATDADGPPGGGPAAAKTHADKAVTLAVNGTIWLTTNGEFPVLVLRIGVKPAGTGGAPFQKPATAYVAADANGGDGKGWKKVDGDDAQYQIFSYDMEKKNQRGLIKALSAGKPVPVVFKRTPDDPPVTVPVDLTVADSTYVSVDQVKRHHSNAAISQFAGCAERIENIKRR